MPKAVESFVFRVAGVTNYKKAVKATCNDIAEEYGIPEVTKYYRNLSSSEIREELEGLSNKIFKYEDMSTSDVELIMEPDNQYDPNAIKILIANNFVGYVPAKIAKKINKYLVDDKYFNTASAEIVGGPYKEFDYIEDKVVTINNLDIGFEIALIIYDSTQTETPVLVEQTQVQEQSTDNISSVVSEEFDCIEDKVVPNNDLHIGFEIAPTISDSTQTETPVLVEQTQVQEQSTDNISSSVNTEENKTDEQIESNDDNIGKATETIDHTAYFEMLENQKKARQKILFALLYGFLALFGLSGIPIFPLLAIPLTVWSIYKLIKLFKK
ncbi:HIRAN domain-containing protein [Streptococcus suis]|nr:HIRAN domain-containing protein [Streptococcus suis]